MKSKLIERINSVYTQIEASEKELSKDLSTVSVDRVNNLSIGAKGIRLQELNLQFFTTMDIFLNDEEGTLEELSENIRNYYNLFNDLKKPIEEADPEEIKKIKEFINSYKNEDNSKNN